MKEAPSYLILFSLIPILLILLTNFLLKNNKNSLGLFACLTMVSIFLLGIILIVETMPSNLRFVSAAVLLAFFLCSSVFGLVDVINRDYRGHSDFKVISVWMTGIYYFLLFI